MTFKQTKRDLLVELTSKLQKNPYDVLAQQRFIDVRKAESHDDLNPQLAQSEYVKLIDLAYEAVTVKAHMKITLKDNRISNAELAKPGTKGFHSPASFLL